MPIRQSNLDGQMILKRSFNDATNHMTLDNEPAFMKKVDEESSVVTYIGRTYDHNAADSDAVWQIQRILVSGFTTVTEYANEGNFDQVWDNRASLFGAPAFDNSYSLQMDGANDYLDVTNDAVIDFDFRSEAASFNVWIKTSNTSGAKTYMEKQASNTGWRFYLASQDLTLELRATGTGDRIRVRTTPSNTVGNTLNDGSWHMITATYDGSGNASGVSLYIDGVAETVETQNDTLTGDSSNAANAAVGSRSGGGDNFGPGNIDEASVWDVELTADEVSTIYNSGVPINLQAQTGTPIAASLNCWLRMGDGTNDVYPTIEDVENNISATMTNMTSGDLETEVPR